MSRDRLRALLAAVLVAVLATGCAALPVAGPVHREADAPPGTQSDAPYFHPPGPAKDGTPAAIVSGFLVAMTANPLSTSVAREFLSSRVRDSWQPNKETIVYEASSVEQTAAGADVRLADTRRLDARGGWRGGAPGSTETLGIRLVSENGQWRVDNPVDALVVPTSFFDRNFSRFNLYFYDQGGRVLLPDPVFIPRGEQTASNLVRGLLAGPSRNLAEISRSAIPSRTALDFSVVVTESGIAEVPLSRELLQSSPAEVSMAVDQLAWTLRQVPGISRVRITVGGAPVPLPDGRIDVSVSSGAEFDAGRTADDPQLWAIRGGRVVDLGAAGAPAVPGRFGRAGYVLRSLAVSEVPRRLAAVSGNGVTLFTGRADGGPESATIGRAFSGTDLLRPGFDLYGDLWFVDRTREGAKVYVLRGDRVQEVTVAGVTGAAVAGFAVARDGNRLAFALGGTPAPPVRVVDVMRTDDGVVSGVGQVRPVATGLSDTSRLVDIGWRDPATLAVLSRPNEETSEVHFVSDDGSPVASDTVEPAVFRGQAASLVVAPDPDLPLRLVTADQRLHTLTSSGQWPRSDTRVVAAGYGQ